MGKISHHRISRIAVQSASGRRGAGCPGPVAGIGDRRMLPQRLQGDLRLRRRIDLPSRLRRHHPLRLSQQNDPLLTGIIHEATSRIFDVRIGCRRQIFISTEHDARHG